MCGKVNQVFIQISVTPDMITLSMIWKTTIKKHQIKKKGALNVERVQSTQRQSLIYVTYKNAKPSLKFYLFCK